MSQFELGAAFGLLCYLTFQDYLGLEGYVAHVRAHWMTLSPWVCGIAAAVVFIIAGISSYGSGR
jgi:hypothetical protein